MKSSLKILKSNQFIVEESAKVIETVLEVEEALEDVRSELSEEENSQLTLRLQQLREMENQAETLHEAALQEKEQLLEAARLEAAHLKETAEVQGFQEGRQSGYEEGYQTGLQEGYRDGVQETEELKQEAVQQIERAQQEVFSYQQEKKEDLLQLAVSMAEKILHHQLDLSEEGVLELVRPQLELLDREPDALTLFVHPTQVERVKEQLPKLKNAHPATRFTVLSDRQLEETGCVMESSRFVIDLQLKKQLDAMLKEMERA